MYIYVYKGMYTYIYGASQVVNYLPANAEDTRDVGSVPGLG